MASELTPYQKDILVRTALGEARGEGVEGMADVIQVILNRANSGEFPSDPAAAALQPNEFSTWNTGEGGNNPQQFSVNSDIYRSGLRALDLVLSGTRPDYTGGALFYKTPSVSSPFHDRQNKYGTIERNGHLYYPTRPVPPGEIPNQVASLTDTIAPRVAPTPAISSPDLAMMRNPVMSSSARMAQVTPPLPQRRPVSPMDISRGPGTTIATIPTRPGQSQIERITPMPSARDIASAPGVTVATIPTSNIGRPPTTRVVQSVPNPMQPTAREIAEAPGTTVATIPTASPSQVQQAARRAALTANQSYVDRAPPPRANALVGSAVNNIREQQLEQLGQRAATNIPARLSPGVAAQNYDVAINGPPGLTRQQFAALPTPPARTGLSAPTPLPANARPLAAPNLSPTRTLAPAPQAAPAPLRIVVNGGNQVASALATQPVAPQPMTVVQALMAQGLSPSQAYDAANARARGPTNLEDRVSGKGTSASSGASAYSISG